jgi:hypothetical protein
MDSRLAIRENAKIKLQAFAALHPEILQSPNHLRSQKSTPHQTLRSCSRPTNALSQVGQQRAVPARLADFRAGRGPKISLRALTVALLCLTRRAKAFLFPFVRPAYTSPFSSCWGSFRASCRRGALRCCGASCRRGALRCCGASCRRGALRCGALRCGALRAPASAPATARARLRGSRRC